MNLDPFLILHYKVFQCNQLKRYFTCPLGSSFSLKTIEK